MQNLGEIIRNKRIAKGMTVAELSKATMLSVAVINDIENGAFDRYKGDETYVKMYLKKISRELDLDDIDITRTYIALTQELEKGIAEEKEAAKSNILKDFSFDNPQFSAETQTVVYRDPIHIKVIRILIIIILMALLICGAFVGMYYFKSRQSQQNETVSISSASVESTALETTTSTTSQASSLVATEEVSSEAAQTTAKQTTPSKTVLKRTGSFTYEVTLPEGEETFEFKAKFLSKAWAALYVNGKRYPGFKAKTYRKSDVRVKLNSSKVQSLRFRCGNNKKTITYINGQRLLQSPKDKKKVVVNIRVKVK